ALGDPRLPAVEQVERGLDRFAHRPVGRGSDVVAPLEGVVDGPGKLGLRHPAKSPAQIVGRIGRLSKIGQGESSVVAGSLSKATHGVAWCRDTQPAYALCSNNVENVRAAARLGKLMINIATGGSKDRCPTAEE